MGWAVQDPPYFEGDVWPRVMGNDAATQAPLISEGIKAGLVVGGGTDGPRLAPYNPFAMLGWLHLKSPPARSQPKVFHNLPICESGTMPIALPGQGFADSGLV